MSLWHLDKIACTQVLYHGFFNNLNAIYITYGLAFIKFLFAFEIVNESFNKNPAILHTIFLHAHPSCTHTTLLFHSLDIFPVC